MRQVRPSNPTSDESKQSEPSQPTLPPSEFSATIREIERLNLSILKFQQNFTEAYTTFAQSSYSIADAIRAVQKKMSLIDKKLTNGSIVTKMIAEIKTA